MTFIFLTDKPSLIARRVFIPLQKRPGFRVSGILFLKMLSSAIVLETRNSLWNATMVRSGGRGALLHHALGDRHEQISTMKSMLFARHWLPPKDG
jgi:hypothetical protein